jgi:serine/threonine protein kinase/DNA-binding response OmpR family regulator
MEPRSDRNDQLHHDLNGLAGHVVHYANFAIEELESGASAEALSDVQKLRAAAQRIISLLDGEVLSVPDEAAVIVQPTPEPEPPGSGCLLVVDDDPAAREVILRRFGASGYRVVEAASGVDAQRVLAAEKVDVVVLDVSMPDASGYDILRVIRKEHKDAELPVIMVTSMDSPADIVAALDAGANDYVRKGTDLRVLSARVRTQIRLKRANDTIEKLNDELRVAQEKIARMADPSGEALQNIPGWAAAVAKDLAPSLRAGEISVWIIDNDAVVPLAETAAPAPSLAQIQEAQRKKPFLIDGDRTVVAVAGMTGHLSGALVAQGKVQWSDAERQLIATFAFQLGGALDLKQVRAELERARAQEAEARKAIQREGLRVLRVCTRCERCYDESAQECRVDGAPLEERPVPLVIGDKYHLVRRLGKGGMGEVFHARDLRLHREVAIKVISPERTSDMLRKQFAHEARSLAAVRSPHVVAIYEYGEIPGGSAFLVTELLGGIDLRGLLDRCGAGTPQQVARLIRQAGRGLSAAHAAGLIHRDIKPANIFLVDDGPSFAARVIDFGIAKNLYEGTMTLTELLAGTPPYMAPEQLGAQPLTDRSDIYSFAVTAWEALTGKRLVRAERLPAIMMEVMLMTRRRPSSVLSGVPAELDECFARALSRSPEHRPADIESWAAATADILQAMPASVKGWPSPLPRIIVPDGAPTSTDGNPGATAEETPARERSS